jgi:hypothetical protein
MIYHAPMTGNLGNQILFYNNIVQIAKATDAPFECDSWEHAKYFNLFRNSHDTRKLRVVKVNSRDLIDIYDKTKKYTKDEFFYLVKNNNIIVSVPFLGELFFQYNHCDPRDNIQLKDEYQLTLPDNQINIGIHIRNNGDEWDKINNNTSMLPSEYYINSILACVDEYAGQNIKFFLISGINSKFLKNTGGSVNNYPPFVETEAYLKDNDIPFEYCITANINKTDAIWDFSQMSQCDVIISSVSTFCLCAGFLGKKNKKIIHSRKWIEYAANKKDTFWKDLYNGGNEHYKIWKCI